MLYGMANVPGAPGNFRGFGPSAIDDLVYRGEPSNAEPMPYYGGNMNAQTVAQGIPVGEDPRFPMDQQSFWQYVDAAKLQRQLQPYGGSLIEYIRQNPVNRGVRGV